MRRPPLTDEQKGNAPDFEEALVEVAAHVRDELDKLYKKEFDRADDHAAIKRAHELRHVREEISDHYQDFRSGIADEAFLEQQYELQKQAIIREGLGGEVFAETLIDEVENIVNGEVRRVFKLNEKDRAKG